MQEAMGIEAQGVDLNEGPDFSNVAGLEMFEEQKKDLPLASPEVITEDDNAAFARISEVADRRASLTEFKKDTMEKKASTDNPSAKNTLVE